MDISWLGTAGFIVRSKDGEIVFDPFYSRGSGKASPFHATSFANAQAVFVGHGHFDHTYDIPEISKNSDARIFAPGLTGHLLSLRGVEKSKINLAQPKEILVKDLKVRAFKSSHVVFDLPLIVSTIKRCGVRGCMGLCGRIFSYPKGMVQTYSFEAEGKKFLFASSGGLSDQELEIYRQENFDVFLAPLQGHTHIQRLAAEQVMKIHPKIVIPHHHDDFFPPLSQEISVDGLRFELSKLNFKGEVKEIPLFGSITI